MTTLKNLENASGTWDGLDVDQRMASLFRTVIKAFRAIEMLEPMDVVVAGSVERLFPEGLIVVDDPSPHDVTNTWVRMSVLSVMTGQYLTDLSVEYLVGDHVESLKDLFVRHSDELMRELNTVFVSGGGDKEAGDG